MKKLKSLDQIQNEINEWIINHGDYWPPLSMLCAIMEELGELAREINQYEGFKPKKFLTAESKLEEEFGDLQFSIICMANHYKINIIEALIKSMNKYFKRDNNRFSK